MGWGLDAHWSALAARARAGRSGSSTPRPVRHLRAVAGAYPRDAAMAEAEAFLDGRAVRDARRRRPRRWPSTGRSDAGRDRRGVLPARRRPRAGRLGAPPGAGGARRRRRRARARAAPPRALEGRAGAARPGRARRAAAPAAARRSSTGSRSATCRSSPRRGRAPTARWGAWAAPTLALALRRLRRAFPFDLVHAHYAAPGGDAVRRARPGAPYVVSVHGGDVLVASPAARAASAAVRGALGGARLVLANSAAIEQRARALGARPHAGRAPRHGPPRRAPSADDADGARDRRATWSRASATPTSCARCGCCATRIPTLRWIVVGDGPERPALERLAARARARGRVRLHAAQLAARRGGRDRAPRRGVRAARASTRRSASPTSRRWRAACPRSAAAASRGRRRSRPPAAASGSSPPGDPGGAGRGAARAARRAGLAAGARRARRAPPSRPSFTWPRCGEATVAAYEEALR